jgi:hypothetical protein
MNTHVSGQAMHIAGLIFLWANRLYCVARMVHGARVILRSGPGPMRSTAVNVTLIAIWQLFGTYLLVDVLGMNPFHLLWWYPVGWAILAIFEAIATDVRRLLKRIEGQNP